MDEVLGLIDPGAPHEECEVILRGAKDWSLVIERREAAGDGRKGRDHPAGHFRFLERKDAIVVRLPNRESLGWQI